MSHILPYRYRNLLILPYYSTAVSTPACASYYLNIAFKLLVHVGHQVHIFQVFHPALLLLFRDINRFLTCHEICLVVYIFIYCLFPPWSISNSPRAEIFFTVLLI